MKARTASTILKPGEALARHRFWSIIRNAAAIGLASLLIGVALGQGLGLGDLAAQAEFWSAITPIALMTLLTVEVLKRRAPDALEGLRGTLVSLGVGLGWGVAMHFSPVFRMFDTLPDSVTYGAISGIMASGVYDVVVSPVQSALAKVGTARTVQVLTSQETITTQEVQDESNRDVDSFAARVAQRDGHSG